MKIIHKYSFDQSFSTVEILMPVGAKILCVREQQNFGAIWVEVDSKPERYEVRKFNCVLTGQEFEHKPEMEYIGTCHYISYGEFPFVVHIFEMK